jgi:hypothetical protein
LVSKLAHEKGETSVNSLGTDTESNICESSNISKNPPQKCCFIQNEQILQIQIDDKYVNSSVMVIEIMSC